MDLNRVLDLYRQARQRMAQQIAIIGAQAQCRRKCQTREQLRADGLLPEKKDLPAFLRDQAD